MIARELDDELKDAMRQKDRARTNVIRQIKTEITLLQAAEGFDREVDDDLYVEVIDSYVRKMQKAKAEFDKAGERGEEQAQKLAFEIDYLARWLPDKLDEDATRALVAQTIDEVGASSPKDVGRVMGAVMKSGQELDGGLVNRIVREHLEA